MGGLNTRKSLKVQSVEKGGKPPSLYAMLSSFLCGRFFKISHSAFFCTLLGAGKTLEGLLPTRKKRRADCGRGAGIDGLAEGWTV
jgi:hypothetical protein